MRGWGLTSKQNMECKYIALTGLKREYIDNANGGIYREIPSNEVTVIEVNATKYFGDKIPSSAYERGSCYCFSGTDARGYAWEVLYCCNEYSDTDRTRLRYRDATPQEIEDFKRLQTLFLQ